MRMFLSVIISCLMASAVAQGAAEPGKIEHPGEVALTEQDGGFVYRTFPAQLRMYVYDKDKPGKIACGEGCINAWPPVWAPSDATPKGDWTLIDRPERGRKQWVYKGRPVYTRFHDTPTETTGVGLDGGAWRLMEP